jgi:hypothetical protein
MAANVPDVAITPEHGSRMPNNTGQSLESGVSPRRHLQIRVDGDGSRSVTLAVPLNAKKVSGYGFGRRRWLGARASAQTGHPDHATGRPRTHAPESIGAGFVD